MRVCVWQYRVCQEGIDSIWPYMTRQLLRPSFADFVALLQRGHVLLRPFHERTDAFAAALRADVRDGCVVLLVHGEGAHSLVADRTLALAAWKTPHSLALMIPQHERRSLLNLLTHTDTNPNTNTNTGAQPQHRTPDREPAQRVDGLMPHDEGGGGEQRPTVRPETGSAEDVVAPTPLTP